MKSIATFALASLLTVGALTADEAAAPQTETTPDEVALLKKIAEENAAQSENEVAASEHACTDCQK